MKVGELMTGVNVITAPPETPMVDARRRMLEERIRHLLVTEDGRLVGIVRPRHSPEPALAGDELVRLGDQPSADEAHGRRGHDPDGDHDRTGP